MNYTCTRLALVALGLATMSALSLNPKRIKANLSTLTHKQAALVQTQSAQAAGGATTRMQRLVETTGSTVRAHNQGVVWQIQQDHATLDVTPAALQLPTTWMGFDSLVLEVQSARNLNLTVHVVGHRSQLVQEQALVANTPTRMALSLLDLPLAAHASTPYQPQYIRLSSQGAELPSFVLVKDVELIGSSEWNPTPVVDPFGQRKSTTWEGKIKSDQDLAHRLIEERKDNHHRGHKATEKRLHALRNATGTFTIASKDGWYYLQGPDGKPFWSMGVTGVRPKSLTNLTDVTPVRGREHLFAHLPTEVPQAWQDEDNVSFYARNVVKKYGSLEGWRQMAETRLPAWGINTLGSWSDPMLFNQPRMPFTVALQTTRPGALTNFRMPGGFPDIYHPDYFETLDSTWSEIERFAREPMLVGYFVDNEMKWQEMDLLAAGPNTGVREAWLLHVRSKYSSLTKLNNSCKTHFKSWDEVKQLTQAKLPKSLQSTYKQFELVYAEDYFKIVKKTLRLYDESHLYLGTRFTKRLIKPELANIVARYADVITVNIYDSIPTLAAEWHRLTNKPILVGEFHFPQAGPRQLAPTYKAFTPAERQRLALQYMKTLAQTPGVIGCHWYQYADQPLTGRTIDGENQIVGLADVTDTPHTELRQAFRMAADSLPYWRPVLEGKKRRN